MRTSRPTLLRLRGRCPSLPRTGLPAIAFDPQLTTEKASVSIEFIGKPPSHDPIPFAALLLTTVNCQLTTGVTSW